MNGMVMLSTYTVGVDAIICKKGTKYAFPSNLVVPFIDKILARSAGSKSGVAIVASNWCGTKAVAI